MDYMGATRSADCTVSEDMERRVTLEYWLDDSWYVGRIKEMPALQSGCDPCRARRQHRRRLRCSLFRHLRCGPEERDPPQAAHSQVLKRSGDSRDLRQGATPSPRFRGSLRYQAARRVRRGTPGLLLECFRSPPVPSHPATSSQAAPGRSH